VFGCSTSGTVMSNCTKSSRGIHLGRSIFSVAISLSLMGLADGRHRHISRGGATEPGCSGFPRRACGHNGCGDTQVSSHIN
jgi:hypothetical protein